jgi:7-keto-8-aminopelargonate synthetase-like enzyme
MDPAHPVRPVNDGSLTRVQRLIASILMVTTVGHLAVGLAVAAFLLPADEPQARIGLTVIAVLFAALGVAGAFAIHRRPRVDQITRRTPSRSATHGVTPATARDTRTQAQTSRTHHDREPRPPSSADHAH